MFYQVACWLSEKPEQEASVNHSHVQCSDVFRSGTHSNFVHYAIFTMLTITAIINHTVDPQNKQSLKHRVLMPGYRHHLFVTSFTQNITWDFPAVSKFKNT